jgi:hypothetical protein
MSHKMAFVFFIGAAMAAAVFAPISASARDWQAQYHGVYGSHLVRPLIAPASGPGGLSYPGSHGPIGLCRPTGQNFLCQ